jgi:putative sterol carrier protein
MDVKDDVTVQEYFETNVPELFGEQLGGKAVSGMDGTLFTIQFDIDGQVYGLKVADAKDLEVVSGALDAPMITVKLSEDVWRRAVTGKLAGAMDMFTDMGSMANRRSYDNLKSAKGTMNLELDASGTPVNISVCFNGSDAPACTFKAAVEDWSKVSTGEVPGPMAFMQGKLKIDGDMPFAMSLSNLMA